MNQDFTEKKATFVSKKKFMQFKLKNHHFSNGPSLN